MIRVIAFAEGREVAWRGQHDHVWIDIEAPSAAELAELKAHFSLNPLALEDVLVTDHWGRFERYPEHFFLIFRTLADPRDVEGKSDGVDIFWFPEEDVLISVRDTAVPYLASIWQKPAANALKTFYVLLQRGSDTFLTYVDALEDTTDALEQRVLSGRMQKRTQVYGEVLHLRRSLILARKLLANARENVRQLARHAVEVSEEAGILMRDVDDHLERAYDTLDTARELVNSLLDIYFAAQNTRMNETMRTLTTVSTVFLPLTFLAGVWGMNFTFTPEFDWRYGYLFAWGCFVGVGSLLLWYFKRRGWW